MVLEEVVDKKEWAGIYERACGEYNNSLRRCYERYIPQFGNLDGDWVGWNMNPFRTRDKISIYNDILLHP